MSLRMIIPTCLPTIRICAKAMPTEPRATSYYLFHQYLESERFSGWTKFMPEWERDPVLGKRSA